MKIFLLLFIAVQLVAGDLSQGIDLLAGCDSTYTNDTGVVTSPHFPENYDPFTNCTWLIFAPAGKSIQLTFTSFILEEDRDFVMIYDGPTNLTPLLMNHSGFVPPNPNPVVSSANSMFIQMTSNGGGQYSGFRATYEAVVVTTPMPATTTTPSPTLPSNITCGGALFGSGVIRTVNHPDPYEPNLNCTWLLQSSRPFITLNFTYFETEPKADYVEIWDGWDTTVSPVDKIFGDLIDSLPSYQSQTGNRLALRFVSDESEQKPGFEAEFH